MPHWIHRPQPPLSNFVEMFWLWRGGEVPHTRERLLPTGTVELVIDLRDDRALPVVAGPHATYFEIDAAETVNVIGIHFRPGGIYPFVPMPSSELQNRVVGLDEVWGSFARDARDALFDAPTAEEKLQTLERMLLARVQRPLEQHRFVSFALREFFKSQTRSVAEVTNQIGMSSRRFADRFRDEVGLTPKVFCRVRRFQDALQRIHLRTDVDWIDVALSCGYFDQSHFNHDFREFSGLTPTEYLAAHGEHLNHVPL